MMGRWLISVMKKNKSVTTQSLSLSLFLLSQQGKEFHKLVEASFLLLFSLKIYYILVGKTCGMGKKPRLPVEACSTKFTGERLGQAKGFHIKNSREYL